VSFGLLFVLSASLVMVSSTTWVLVSQIFGQVSYHLLVAFAAHVTNIHPWFGDVTVKYRT